MSLRLYLDLRRILPFGCARKSPTGNALLIAKVNNILISVMLNAL